MKFIKTKKLFYITSLVFYVAATLMATYFSVATPPAYAAGAAEYALYFPDDPATKSDLLAAAKGGGIGSGATNGILSKTYIISKGGPLGTFIMPLNAKNSDSQDVPTYSKDYYCYPNDNYHSTFDAPPDATKPYFRITYGVTILKKQDWSGIANDPNYFTQVGMLGDAAVGTAHFSSVQNGSVATVGPKDFDLQAAGGPSQDYNINDRARYPPPDLNNPNDATTFSYNNPLYGAPAGNKADLDQAALDKCRMSPRGKVANKAINLSKANAATKAEWDKAVKDAGLGDTAAAAANASAASSGGDGTSPGLKCDVKFYNPLTWLLCPAVKGMVNIIGSIDDIITSQLSVGSPGNSGDPNQIFCNKFSSGSATKSCQAYESAWKSFRNIALGLMVIVGLIVVIAQALGMEILDAYAIRKVLPRLIIVAIAITLSWRIMGFFVEFTNDLGYGIRFLIYQPFTKAGFDQATLGGGGSVATAIVGAVAIQALGIFGLLSFAVTAALAVAIAFLLLIIRQLVIVVLIVFAPIAILAYVLPNTQKVYQIWWDSFSKALLMFPIIAAMIAAGRVFSAVSATSNSNTLGQFIGFVAYFAPYFLIPKAFQFAGGALRNIGGFVNSKGNGAFGQLKKFRQGQYQSHGARKIEGAGRRVLAKRADINDKLQNRASSSKSVIGRKAYGRLASTTAGYNLAALNSAKQASVGKEIEEQIATGRDEEIRGLLIDKKKATVANGDMQVKDGKRQFKSLGGKWIDEAHVDAGQRRWGNDNFAKQAALSYEIRKTDSVEDVEHLKAHYGHTATASGMSDNQAYGAWVGATFANQNQHLELKHTSWEDGSMSASQASAFASEAYEKKGSYQMAQMHASTIKQLGAANTIANGDGQRGQNTKSQIAGVAETFVSRFGATGAGGGPGDDPAAQAALQHQQAQIAAAQAAAGGGAAAGAGGVLLGPNGRPIASSTITTNTPGAGSVAAEVRKLAVETGVLQELNPATDNRPIIRPPNIDRQN